MKSQYGEVSLKPDGRVAILEIDRPPNNFVSVELTRDLADALDDIDGEPAMRATVLASAGKNFSAGADLVSPGGVGASGMSAIGSLYVEAVRLFSAKKPIVAAIQGAAVGAGLGLALVADFRIASPDARFSANFVKLGFHPGFGITHTLPRLIGEQKASLMCLTGRRVKAEDAMSWGLVDELARADQLRAFAVAYAREIAENAPLAVQSTRATLRAGLAEAVRSQTDRELAEQASLRQTADFAEGVRSVNERRPGNFVGA